MESRRSAYPLVLGLRLLGHSLGVNYHQNISGFALVYFWVCTVVLLDGRKILYVINNLRAKILRKPEPWMRIVDKCLHR